MRAPAPDNSVEVLYTSHMIEHLDRDEVRRFLREAYRVLMPNGVIRIVVPDIEKIVKEYISYGDADTLIEKTLLACHKPKSLIDKIKYLVIGHRKHLWMYDGKSLSKLLVSMGFINPQILAPGFTTISNPGKLNLYERAEESVIVEARK